MTSAVTLSYGTQQVLAVTALASLANSATAGWGSTVVDNRSTKAIDFQIGVRLPMANTAPANDRTVYLYAVPAWYDAANATWRLTDQGTTTLPSGTDAATTIATPNDLRLLSAMAYTTQNMTLQGTFMLSEAIPNMPEGFALIVVNYSGAAIGASPIIDVTPITLEISP